MFGAHHPAVKIAQSPRFCRKCNGGNYSLPKTMVPVNTSNEAVMQTFKSDRCKVSPF